MDAFHKILTFLTSPLTVGLLMLGLGLLLGRGKLKRAFLLLSFLWIYLWSTPLMTKWNGLTLETLYPPVAVESLPNADAICILGGGMNVNTNVCVYPELNGCADRVWHGARLYNASKATNIYVTCTADVALLKDLGVPKTALCYNTEARNTEEEATCMARRGVKRVALVTSAWHMRRAEWLFRRAGLEVIPAAADYEATVRLKGAHDNWLQLLPNAENLSINAYLFKEHFAYWCYRLRDYLQKE